MTTDTAMQKFTLAGLIKEYDGGIRIPMIQRDYAQGRPSWVNSRNRFLCDIRKSLMPTGRPLHLDFVYGIKQEEDSVGAFCPLDGQQRLTTLFLLHWSLAARDGCFEEFQVAFRNDSRQPKFSYQVRPGGRAFFQLLVEHAPSADEWKIKKPTAWFRQQSWFRSIWEQDPSVAGALVMLDAIHEHFKDHPEASFRNLMDGNRITFQRLDLEAVGLHDDLYLSMNARGRPLSTFETFKARLDKLLETEFPNSEQLGRCTVKSAKDFADRIDTQWLDFILNRYGPKESETEDTSSIDKAFINLFRAVALVSLQPTREDKEKNITKEDAAKMDSSYVQALSTAEPDYDDFENGGWLTTKFTSHLIHVLEACESCKSHDADLVKNFILDQSPWFGEGSLLDHVVRHNKKPDLTDFLQFAACLRFFTHHGTDPDELKVGWFREWIRVVRNLVLNSDVRADTFRSMLTGIDRLSKHCNDILQFLSKVEYIEGFDKNQVEEERVKALLIIKEPMWLQIIQDAENHGYFRGQIGFLIKASLENPKANSIQDQAGIQATRFQMYFHRAIEMFGPDGLNLTTDFLWERALLANRDYFLGFGKSSKSFLVNERTSSVGWKQFLKKRGASLRVIWDRMPSESLHQIAATPTTSSWRNALCSTPEAWSYCKQRLIRFTERESKNPQVFLLSAQRRRAEYAELFTYCLMKKERLEQKEYRSRFSPLEFVRLMDNTGSDDDPHLWFELDFKDKKYPFQLYCQYDDDNGFSLWTPAKDLESELLSSLVNIGFASEMAGTTKFYVFRQKPSALLNGMAFLDSVATALRGTLPPS